MWHKLKIGVHYNAEVTSKDWGEILSKSPEQQITQVTGQLLWLLGNTGTDLATYLGGGGGVISLIGV